MARGRRRTVRKLVGMSLLFALAGLLAGCRLFGYIGEPERYVMWGDELVLAWDPPGGFSAGPRVTGYTLLYRAYPPAAASEWVELGTVSASGPRRFRVNGSTLAPGRYEFGIRSVDEHDNVSDIHRSTDSHADPPTGWYLEWLGGTP